MSTLTRFRSDHLLAKGVLCEWFTSQILHKDGTQYAFDYVAYSTGTGRHKFDWELFNHDRHIDTEYHVGETPLASGSSPTRRQRQRDITKAIDEAIAEIRSA